MSSDKLPRRMGETSRRLVVDGSLALAARILGLGSAFALNSVVAHQVSEVDFGIFLLVVGFVVVGELLFGWGISDFAVIQVPTYANRNQPEKINHLMGTTLLLVAISSVVVVLAMSFPPITNSLVRISGEPELSRVIQWMFVLLICWSCNGIAGRWVLSLGVGWLFQLSYFVIPRLIAILFVAAQFARGESIDISQVIAWMSAGCLLGAMLCAAVAVHRAGWPSLNLREPLSEVLSRSGNLMSTRLLHVATPWVTLWILSAMTSTHEMAKFGAAHRLLIAVTTAFSSMIVIFKPRLSALYDAQRINELSTICSTLSTLRAVPNLLLVIVAITAGPMVMRIVYGSGYEDAGSLFLFLSLGYLIWVVGGPAIEVLTITGHERQVVRLQMMLITALLVAEFTVLSLSSRAGFSGPLSVAACLTVFYSVSTCVFVLLCRKLIGVDTLCTLSPRRLLAALHVD